MKKRIEKDKKSKKEKVPLPPPPSVEQESEQSDGFDFGGLPKRDLKKNLGCG